MNLLFASDFHIEEQSFEELELVFNEILEIKEANKIDKIIIPGDSFDRISPTSKELDFLSTFIKKLNCQIILIAANSHESTTQEDSVINHIGILRDDILVCKEWKDEHRLFAGHFIVKQSTKNKGGTINQSELKDYRNVVLGHGHIFELVKPNLCQLGSIRFISFGEDPAINKKVAICYNYGEKDQGWQFIDLKTPYPLIDIELCKMNISKDLKIVQNDPPELRSGKQGKAPKPINKAKIAPSNPMNRSSFGAVGELCSFLDKTSPKSKVRVVFKDYSSWVNFLPFYQRYKDKFYVMRDKKDFLVTIDNTPKDNKKETMRESLIKWMTTNKIEDKIQKILLEEIK